MYLYRSGSSRETVRHKSPVQTRVWFFVVVVDKVVVVVFAMVVVVVVVTDSVVLGLSRTHLYC